MIEVALDRSDRLAVSRAGLDHRSGSSRSMIVGCISRTGCMAIFANTIMSDPSHPKLAAQVWCGGVLGKKVQHAGRELAGGPQMLQLSLDGRRLYVTNSLYSSWDDQFYPKIAKSGSYLLQIDCDPEGGNDRQRRASTSISVGSQAGRLGLTRCAFPGGDCTSDIWV